MLTSTVCDTENEILLVFCFCFVFFFPGITKLPLGCQHKHGWKTVMSSLLYTSFPGVAKWEQMRLRRERQGLSSQHLYNLHCLLWSQKVAVQFTDPAALGEWAREDVMNVVPLLCFSHMQSGRWTNSDSPWLRDTHTHTLGEDSRPRLQHSTADGHRQCVTVTRSWRGASLMSQHHNGTAGLAASILDASVMLATCVIRLTLRRSLKWEEQGKMCLYLRSSDGIASHIQTSGF